jgi:hypothetical protein
MRSSKSHLALERLFNRYEHKFSEHAIQLNIGILLAERHGCVEDQSRCYQWSSRVDPAAGIDGQVAFVAPVFVRVAFDEAADRLWPVAASAQFP